MKECILYSFRRCPYAIRARWALLNCNLKVQIREVELKKKPLELIKASNKSTVPVLITSDGEIIEESIDIINWALSKGRDPLNFTNHNEKIKKHSIELIEENDKNFKYHLDRVKYPNRYPYCNPKENKIIAEKILVKWNELIKLNADKNDQGWLVSKNESIADWSLWPFVRQYRLINYTEFDQDKRFEYLQIWLNHYLESNLYKTLMRKYKSWESTDSITYFP